MSDHSVKDFITLWKKCVRRLLKLPRKTHCRFLPHLAKRKDPHDKICAMFMAMHKKMLMSSNQLVAYLASRGLVNSNKITTMNLNYILRFYRSTDLKKCNCHISDFTVIEAIKDILDNNLDYFLSDSERVHLLSSFCEI